MTRQEMIERLDSAEARRVLGGECSDRLQELLKASCGDCENAKCFYDREPVCSHFEQKGWEL
jgi:hypothetical protein